MGAPSPPPGHCARDEGRPARVIPVVGLAGCLILAFALPPSSIISGAAVLALGAAAYGFRGGSPARRVPGAACPASGGVKPPAPLYLAGRYRHAIRH